MPITAQLIEQHQEILILIQKVDEGCLAGNKNTVSVLDGLEILRRKVNLHIALEDRAFFPMMIKRHPSADIRHMVDSFMLEWSPLTEIFNESVHNWVNNRMIKERFDEFVGEIIPILHTLRGRIRYEENQIFPHEEAM